jgi:hypothetical protein
VQYPRRFEFSAIIDLRISANYFSHHLYDVPTFLNWETYFHHMNVFAENRSLNPSTLASVHRVNAFKGTENLKPLLPGL